MLAMQVQTGDLSLTPPIDVPIALTVGNFDGIHLGHQFLIENLIRKAGQYQAWPAVLFFDPHPEQVLFPDHDFSILSTSADKQQSLKELGVKMIFVQDFSRNFSKVPAVDFLKNYLGQFRGLRYLLVGYDFHFGLNGEGDFNLIRDFFAKSNTEVERGSIFKEGDLCPSSTRIRNALKEGDVKQAADCLGRPYQLQGEVLKGKSLGRQLGFPTANLANFSTQRPADGVYITRAIHQNKVFNGVTNVGVRPTVQGCGVTVETHLFDFDENLYGQTLKVQFLERIRSEKKFESLEMLKKQIHHDITVARKFFERNDR